jgi:hypothetical protein
MAAVMSVEQVHEWAGQQYQVGEDPKSMHPVLDEQQSETQGPHAQNGPPESVHRQLQSIGQSEYTRRGLRRA